METIYTLIVHIVLASGGLTATTDTSVEGFTTMEACEQAMFAMQEAAQNSGSTLQDFAATCIADTVE